MVVVYAASNSRSASIGVGDAFLFAALVCAAAAYAEGGRLARTMPDVADHIRDACRERTREMTAG